MQNHPVLNLRGAARSQLDISYGGHKNFQNVLKSWQDLIEKVDKKNSSLSSSDYS